MIKNTISDHIPILYSVLFPLHFIIVFIIVYLIFNCVSILTICLSLLFNYSCIRHPLSLSKIVSNTFIPVIFANVRYALDIS